MNNNQKQGKPKASQVVTAKTTTTKVVNTRPQVQHQKKHEQPNSRLSSAYVQTLNDPVTHPGVPLGFGSLVGTKCSTSSFRTKITANATDGSLTFHAYPGADWLGAYHSQALGTAPNYGNYAPLIDSSVTSARDEFQSARCISACARITPLSSANDKPSRISAGLIAYSSKGRSTGDTDPRIALQSATTIHLYAAHELTNHIVESGGGNSVQVLWRPQDLECFAFQRNFMYFDNASSTVVLPPHGPSLTFAVIGPPGLEYTIDITCRYEGLPNVSGLFTGDVRTSSLSDMYSSIESMWSKLSPRLVYESIKTSAEAANVVYDAWMRTQPSFNPKSFSALLASKEKDKDKDEKQVTRSESRSYFS